MAERIERISPRTPRPASVTPILPVVRREHRDEDEGERRRPPQKRDGEPHRGGDDPAHVDLRA